MVKVSPPPTRIPFVEPKTGNLTVAGRDFLETMWVRSGAGGDKTVIVAGTGTPALSVDNALARFDGTAGDKFQSSGVKLDDSENFRGALELLHAFETTVGQAALVSTGTVTLLNAVTGEQWKVREIFLSGDGTNFSGGDRLLDIKEGTRIYSEIPAATLQSLAVARWGDAGTPFPVTALDLTTATALGQDIVAQYSGGATDYTAGSLTIVLIAEQVK